MQQRSLSDSAVCGPGLERVAATGNGAVVGLMPSNCTLAVPIARD
jgi:hypothetical protein